VGYLEQYPEILKDLGKHKHGKGCLYVNKLEDINMGVLRTLIETSIRRLKVNQPD
jgi:archaellum biogenesis protein FlaJ (TadC family)